MSVIGSNIIAGASGTVETGYQIARSLRFNSADSAYLNRTPAGAGNRRTWTWSQWFKFGLIANANYRSFIEAFTGSTDVYNTIAYENGVLKVNQDNGAGGVMLVSTPAVFRDPSAWYHLLVAVDTTQATGTNRVKIWINGVQQTLTFTTTPSQNLDTWINSANAHRMGARWGTVSSASCFDGYMADVNFIDGQALDPTSFGQTDSATGVWVPKAYTGTYGTNGFWLKFDDNSGVTSTTLGKDSSGNGNNWTPNNFSVTAGAGNDSLVDSPTNYGTDTGAGGEVRGNYATWNPINNPGGVTLSNGNLDVTTVVADALGAFGTMAIPSSGKWYFEVTPTTNGGSASIGIRESSTSRISYYGNGDKNVDGTETSYGATYTNNDVIGVAVNVDSGTVTFYKNGTSQGAITYATATKSIFPYVQDTTASLSVAMSANFGQRPFAYTAPSGFKALCTQNLPTPAIGASASTLASKNFNVVTWTGSNTAAGNSVTGVGFSPDFVWSKPRSVAYQHNLYDVIRGSGKRLISNSTAAEETNAAYGYLSSFDSDGFTTSAGATNNENWNQTSATYVAWNWKANGAGVSNTAGSISSTVSANQTAGIAVVTYTGNNTAGATVGHGLGVAPAMIITKSRSGAYNWTTYHRSMGATKAMWLNQTSAEFASASYWNNTAPTSSVFSLGSGSSDSNVNSATYVAYCFAEIAGFSKFGSYTGNGSADGPFVYCGFRPRYVMIKRTDAAGFDWAILDSARSTYNVNNLTLMANTSGAEGTNVYADDFLSNGFKVRDAGTGQNANGGTYIFAAFGEVPFNYSRAR